MIRAERHARRRSPAALSGAARIVCIALRIAVLVLCAHLSSVGPILDDSARAQGAEALHAGGSHGGDLTASCPPCGPSFEEEDDGAPSSSDIAEHTAGHLPRILDNRFHRHEEARPTAPPRRSLFRPPRA